MSVGSCAIRAAVGLQVYEIVPPLRPALDPKAKLFLLHSVVILGVRHTIDEGKRRDFVTAKNSYHGCRGSDAAAFVKGASQSLEIGGAAAVTEMNYEVGRRPARFRATRQRMTRHLNETSRVRLDECDHGQLTDERCVEKREGADTANCCRDWLQGDRALL